MKSRIKNDDFFLPLEIYMQLAYIHVMRMAQSCGHAYGVYISRAFTKGKNGGLELINSAYTIFNELRSNETRTAARVILIVYVCSRKLLIQMVCNFDVEFFRFFHRFFIHQEVQLAGSASIGFTIQSHKGIISFTESARVVWLAFFLRFIVNDCCVYRSRQILITSTENYYYIVVVGLQAEKIDENKLYCE